MAAPKQYDTPNAKRCGKCGRFFGRPKNVTGKQWVKRKYCGLVCRDSALRGKPVLRRTPISCQGCGETLHNAHPSQVRCEACSRKHRRALDNARQKQKYKTQPAYRKKMVDNATQWNKLNKNARNKRNQEWYSENKTAINARKRERYHSGDGRREWGREYRKNIGAGYLNNLLHQQGIDVSCLSEEEANGYLEIKRKIILLQRRLTSND